MIPFFPAAPAIGLGVKLLIGGAIIATITGLFLAGVQTISNGGYARAEAERRAAIAEQNAAELGRERILRAAASKRETAVRVELEAARSVSTPPPSGTLCVPGCTRQ